MKKARLTTSLGLVCALAMAPALAQEGPALTKIVVGYSAGGGADRLARAYADAMRKSLGRSVVVENKPGAGGMIAAAAVKDAPGDGSTLLLGNIVMNVLSAYTFKNLPYDPVNDFVPVGQGARLEIGMAVPATSAANSIADYVDQAKKNPEKAVFGVPGVGGVPHFFGLLLGEAAGVKLVPVPYKGGAQINTDLIGAQLAAGISASSDYIELHNAGRLRLLATSGSKRSASTPDVPTFKEAGYPALTASSWLGFFAPAKTEPRELAKLVASVEQAANDPEVKKAIAGIRMEQPDVNQQQFAELVAADRKRWEPIVKASGFSSDK